MAAGATAGVLNSLFACSQRPELCTGSRRCSENGWFGKLWGGRRGEREREREREKEREREETRKKKVKKRWKRGVMISIRYEENIKAGYALVAILHYREKKL